MPKLKPQDLAAALKKEGPSPVYLLHGDDGRGIERALSDIVAAALADGEDEFNSDWFSGRESSAGEVAAAARMLPMMADRRLVVLKRADEIKGPSRGPLLEYLEDPSPMTVLVMTGPGLQVSGSSAKKDDKKLLAAAGKAGVTIEFQRPKARQLPALVEAMARERGKTADREAVRALIDLAGAETFGLEQEVEKVSLYIGGRKRITADDVLKAVADIKEAGIFEFTDAIGAKNVEEALRIFGKMREQGNEPLMLLGMLARHFRIIWQLQALTSSGMSHTEIARKLRLNEWIMKNNYIPQLNKFPPGDTGRIMKSLADLDIKMKSTRADRDLLFEKEVIGLCLGRLS